MRDRGRKRYPEAALAAILLCMAAVAVTVWYLCGTAEDKIICFPQKFVESAKELKNPDRGFYRISTFWISDQPGEYAQQIQEITKEERDALVLVEICLQDYRDGEISPMGIDNIHVLFRSLIETGKRLIVRFLYDWDGENLEHEPESINVVLGHMEQLGPVILQYQEYIFTLQGAFVGNWGEGNGTRYSSNENMSQLMEKLCQVTEGRVPLAVRTPAQWRSITKSRSPLQKDSQWAKLGLFNDGIMGNESDYGTYGSNDGSDLTAAWTSDLELRFQESLCGYVLNGGEVIIDSPRNDFERALGQLKTMHITYLNRNYDQAVLDKWARTSYQGDGCFAGMDGRTYIERHLGYRLLIDYVEMGYDPGTKWVSIDVNLRNAGFAPIYSKPDLLLNLWNQEEGRQFVCRVDQSLQALTGGNREQDTVAVHADILSSALAQGEYRVYFSMTDPLTGKAVELANEGAPEELGWFVGTIQVK
ncbi:DUF4832 domain-containing protein [Acutalibacter intestini]|uniref:DUF4832 domain-containing protein n=1 Tax=Acutalibacter intestini TaxID=3093659 RepID=UPI002AC99C74|nr:DUF4832 domain-containing protein [Acutalibacter sp. M00204]